MGRWKAPARVCSDTWKNGASNVWSRKGPCAGEKRLRPASEKDTGSPMKTLAGERREQAAASGESVKSRCPGTGVMPQGSNRVAGWQRDPLTRETTP